jgi:nucleoside-diphosphate-sugar epimerase
LWSPLRPQAEAVIHAYSDRVPSVICRFPAIYGPRDRVVLKLFRMVALGFAMTIGPWDRQVSVVHSADATAGLIAAATSPAAVNRTYNVAYPEAITWGQFVQAIGRALGRRPLQVAVPVGAARPIALAAEAAAWLGRRAAVLNRDKVRELAQESWVCDAVAAMDEIGFKPRYSLDTGVAATAVWLRRNQWI